MRNDLRGRLRPMGIADILDETVELYKSNFVLLVGIAAFLYVPYFLLSAFIQEPKNTNPGRLEDIIPYLASVVVMLLFYAIVGPIVTGALTYAISERYLGRAITIGDCYKYMIQKSLFLSLIGANVLAGLAALGSLLLPIFLGGLGAFLCTQGGMALGGGILVIMIALASVALPIFVYGRLLLVSPTFVIEQPGIMGALNRSWALMYANVLKGLALTFIVGIIISIIQGVIVGPLMLLTIPAAMNHTEPSIFVTILYSLLSTIASTLMYPLTSIVVILLYYDIRIRREGFDLELLANELGTTQQYGMPNYYDLPQEQLPTDYPQERENPTDNQC